MSSKVTILKHVDVKTIERYYLQSELLKLAHKLGWDVGDGSVERLSDGELWPMCMVQSWLNQGYTGEFLGRSDFEWFEGICPVDAITLVDVDQQADTTQQSVQHNLDLVEFATTIEYWRNDHQDTSQPLILRHVILRQRGSDLLLLDGQHRLMRQVSEGAKEVPCYYGRPVPTQQKRLKLIGPQVRWLRDLWRTAPNNQVREAILIVVHHLISISSNGERAVEIFWIMYGREPETQAAGRRLLGRNPKGPDRRYDPDTGQFV